MSSGKIAESHSEAVIAYEQSLDKLVTGASGPQSVTGDAGSVTQRPVMDLIAASNYLAGIAASQTASKGVRFTRMIPDGTVQAPRHSFRGRWLGGPSWNGFSWP